jgi:hypothetical protein
MEEPTANFYFEKLNSTTKPIPVLVNFMRSVFELSDDSKKLYPQVGRIVKLYGSKLVFFAILDASDSDVVSSDHAYKLIRYILRKKFADQYDSTPSIDLMIFAEKQKKELIKKRRLTIPELEDENE